MGDFIEKVVGSQEEKLKEESANKYGSVMATGKKEAAAKVEEDAEGVVGGGSGVVATIDGKGAVAVEGVANNKSPGDNNNYSGGATDNS